MSAMLFPLIFLLASNLCFKIVQSRSELILEEFTGSINASSLKGLKYLRISHSAVLKIEENALCSQTLEEISLADNGLPKFTKKMFGKCSSLNSLSFDHNYGMKFENDAISGLVNLKTFIVTDQSFFQQIPRQFFKNLTLLERISIACSSVETIENGAFDDLENLQQLTIAESDLIRIGDGLFKNLKKVKTLDFFWNKLEYFPWNDLEYMKNLEYFGISQNKLTFIDAKKVALLPKLKTFDFSGNPVEPEIQSLIAKVLKDKM